MGLVNCLKVTEVVPLLLRSLRIKALSGTHLPTSPTNCSFGYLILYNKKNACVVDNITEILNQKILTCTDQFSTFKK